MWDTRNNVSTTTILRDLHVQTTRYSIVRKEIVPFNGEARIGDNISRFDHIFTIQQHPPAPYHTTTSPIRPLATLIVAQHEVHFDLDHLFHTRERDGIGGTVQSPMVASYLAVCC